MLSRMQALGRPSSRAFAQRLSTMAYQYSQAGIPSAVISATKLDSPASPPAPGKVVVNWLAAGIDPVDLATLSGAPATSELRPQSFPAVPGTEGVGIVTAVASDITSVKEGDHVIPLKMDIGTWRECGQVAATDVMRVPSTMRKELAATLPGSPATAYRLLRDFATLEDGDVVIQTAAGSPVGTALAQLASQKGVRVISVVCETARDYAPTVERLKLHGSEVAVGQSYCDSAGVRAVLADMPAAKLAVHGGDEAGCAVLARLISKGCPVVTYCPGVADAAALAAVGARSSTFSLADWLRCAKRSEVESMMQEVVGLMECGALTGWLQRVNFNSLPQALKRGGSTRRKLVAMMNSNL